MSNQHADFSYFPQLPTELREQIWRSCLPNRTCELTQPVANIVFEASDNDDDGEGLFPCDLWHTTYMNSRPPLISRVCRESRAVCFQSGGLIIDWHKQQPMEAKWISWADVKMRWQDRCRDAPHLNWHADYEPEYDHDGDPLRCLEWEASRLRGGDPSFMINSLDRFFGFANTVDLGFSTSFNSFDPTLPAEIAPGDELKADKKQDLGTLLKQRRWLVVVRVIVVHCDARSTAQAGLFGLLGDARVQIVEISDEGKMQSYFDLAKRCESNERIVAAQDFRREPADLIMKKLRGTVLRQFHSQQLADRTSPAVMFRLCTQRCNQYEKH